jgi:hypothetical protein
METTQTTGEGLTFEKVWEQMRETDRRMKALSEEVWEQIRATDRQMKETDQRMEAANEKLREQMKETDRRVGAITNRFGEMVEYMIIPNLLAKFEELGFTFTKANRTEIKDREHSLFLEVDALLENGDKVMAVEIKTKPNGDDINDHIERMGKLRTYADLHNDRRIYLGAVAGVVFSESEKIHALKKGLYVIEPSGDTFAITEPKGSCHPREW